MLAFARQPLAGSLTSLPLTVSSATVQATFSASNTSLFVPISSSLAITISTGGFSGLQPTSPVQLFTPATGQRSATLSDIIGSLNETLNGNTDPTSDGADSPDILYSFNAVGDGALVIDAVSSAGVELLSTWSTDDMYVIGCWQ